MEKICRQSRAVGDFFTVVHYMEGKRSRQAFADLGDAVEAAEKIAARIARTAGIEVRSRTHVWRHGQGDVAGFAF